MHLSGATVGTTLLQQRLMVTAPGILQRLAEHWQGAPDVAGDARHHRLLQAAHQVLDLQQQVNTHSQTCPWSLRSPATREPDGDALTWKRSAGCTRLIVGIGCAFAVAASSRAAAIAPWIIAALVCIVA